MQKTLDPSFKGGIIMPLHEVILQNHENYKSFTYKVLKEHLFYMQNVFYYPKNFHLVEIFNEKIGILKSTGIIFMWIDHYIDMRFVKINHKNNEPRIINIEHLLGCFEVWLFGLVLSFFIFILELMSRYRYMTKLKLLFNK